MKRTAPLRLNLASERSHGPEDARGAGRRGETISTPLAGIGAFAASAAFNAFRSHAKHMLEKSRIITWKTSVCPTGSFAKRRSISQYFGSTPLVSMRLSK